MYVKALAITQDPSVSNAIPDTFSPTIVKHNICKLPNSSLKRYRGLPWSGGRFSHVNKRHEGRGTTRDIPVCKYVICRCPKTKTPPIEFDVVCELTEAAAANTGGTGISNDDPPSTRDFFSESVAKMICFLDKSNA